MISKQFYKIQERLHFARCRFGEINQKAVSKKEMGGTKRKIIGLPGKSQNDTKYTFHFTSDISYS